MLKEIKINDQLVSYEWDSKQNGLYTLRLEGKVFQVRNDQGKVFINEQEILGDLWQDGDGNSYIQLSDAELKLNQVYSWQGEDTSAKDTIITSPMPGKILKLALKEGDLVKEGDSLVVLEAMKMEHSMKALAAGKVVKVNCAEGDLVESGAFLLELDYGQ